MKTEKKGVEGQLDIFEAMNRAADAIDRMVEEDQKKKKASGNSGYYRDKTVEYGTVRERRQGTNTGCIGEICECTWKTY